MSLQIQINMYAFVYTNSYIPNHKKKVYIQINVYEFVYEVVCTELY